MSGPGSLLRKQEPGALEPVPAQQGVPEPELPERTQKLTLRGREAILSGGESVRSERERERLKALQWAERKWAVELAKAIGSPSPTREAERSVKEVPGQDCPAEEEQVVRQAYEGDRCAFPLL